MGKYTGMNHARAHDERKAHGTKRITGDATFKSPRRRRVGRMVVSRRAPEPKPDLTVKATPGPVTVDERPAPRMADAIVVSPRNERCCEKRYSHALHECPTSGKHRSMSAHDKRRRPSEVTMIAGR